jgi:hypothetical protein
VAEQVGGAPQQLAPARALKPLEVVDRLGEEAAMLGDRLRLGHHVDVVEAVERHVEPGEEVERSGALGRRGGAVVGARVPRAAEGACAEDVRARPAERVPEAHREAQVVLHPLARDHAVLVVPAVRKLVVGVWSFVTDRGDIGEKGTGHHTLLAWAFGVMRG